MPPIVLYENEVIAGQERVRAIVDFYRNRLTLTGLEIKTELNGLTYSMLPWKIRNILDRRSLSSITIFPQWDATPVELVRLKEIISNRLNLGSSDE